MGLFGSFFGKRPRRVDVSKRFELIGRVGRGSMSKLWKARDRETGRIVALKLLDPEETRKFEARFAGVAKPSEGEVAVRLDHPNVVRTFEQGLTTDGESYLVMEFVDGFPLSLHVDTQTAELRAHRLRFMVELGEAVAYLHAQGFIHRDVCPKNVLVGDDLRVRLVDFGLVVPNTPPFRRPGNRTGTANYMAPELIRRQPTDERIDVFSYAVTCFETCTRRLPWEPAKNYDALVSRFQTPPKDLRSLASELDEAVAAAIMRGLETDRDRRWKSARAMTDALRAAAGPAAAHPPDPEPER